MTHDARNTKSYLAANTSYFAEDRSYPSAAPSSSKTLKKMGNKPSAESIKLRELKAKINAWKEIIEKQAESSEQNVPPSATQLKAIDAMLKYAVIINIKHFIEDLQLLIESTSYDTEQKDKANAEKILPVFQKIHEDLSKNTGFFEYYLGMIQYHFYQMLNYFGYKYSHSSDQEVLDILTKHEILSDTNTGDKSDVSTRVGDISYAGQTEDFSQLKHSNIHDDSYDPSDRSSTSSDFVEFGLFD